MVKSARSHSGIERQESQWYRAPGVTVVKSARSHSGIERQESQWYRAPGVTVV